jgi:SAM-dependent methyltransferase
VSLGYSPRWRTVFGDVDPARTAADVAFLLDALPLPGFRRVLDVPCGDGRLVRELGARGYDVTGVDGDPAVAPAVVADLRELDGLPADFDAVICLWASFGSFDPATNVRVLASFGRRVRTGGRVALDVLNGDFFVDGRSEQRQLRPGVLERSTVRAGRRRCELDYGDAATDVFEWQVYTRAEIDRLLAACGLSLVARLGAPSDPSLRLVLQRDR